MTLFSFLRNSFKINVDNRSVPSILFKFLRIRSSKMLTRLFLSPFLRNNRNSLALIVVGNGSSSSSSVQQQQRNFRRIPIVAARPTSSSSSSTSIVSNLLDSKIPGLKISITPGINITAKRAPTAYNLFVMEKTQKFIDGNKNAKLKFVDNSRRIAGEWKKLAENDRRVYEDESKRIQDEYDHSFVRLSSEEFRRLVFDEMKRAQSRRIVQLRRQQRELKNEHKYPEASGDFFRLIALSKDLVKDGDAQLSKMAVPQRGRRLGQIWNEELSPEERAEYEKREKASRAKYSNDIEAWKKRMVKQGRQDVVDTIGLKTVKNFQDDGAIKHRKRRVSKKKVLASKVASAKKTGGASGGKGQKKKAPAAPRKRGQKKEE